jgi:hypothetical protein
MMQYCPICKKHGCRLTGGYEHMAARLHPSIYAWLMHEIPSLAKAITACVIVLLLAGSALAQTPLVFAIMEVSGTGSTQSITATVNFYSPWVVLPTTGRQIAYMVNGAQCGLIVQGTPPDTNWYVTIGSATTTYADPALAKAAVEQVCA